jgi:superfamily II DNA or RNA helicase
MKLSELTANQVLSGVEASGNVTVVAVNLLDTGTATLVYKRDDGTFSERLLTSAEAAALTLAGGRTWAFDGDGANFKLAVEAKRMDLAFLFDPMMAVHTSNVEPLPHQITAVYESMLPRQPLRFVLADDPGAGKTIMAGLYVRELLLRADARRVLVVAPGSLVEQWRDELWEKFGLKFQVFSREMEGTTETGNPFQDNDLLIVRLDQLARDEEVDKNEISENRQPGLLQTRLIEAGWDLVIFDEAHKLSASYFGSKVEKTGRFRFAERIGARTRHLLLMTATPHNGKEDSFQLFLSLLDSDRFYGKFRDGVHKVDASDLMRRMVKESLVRFDGTPLFPERRARTVNYVLSAAEAELYNAVTLYVKEEMNKADELDGKRKRNVGFALTSLQRRVASSPEAIFQSLKNRRERLQKRLREEKILECGRALSTEDTALPDAPEDEDDFSDKEREEIETEFVDRATASKTIGELQSEIATLDRLVVQAEAVLNSAMDKKWNELSQILQTTESELLNEEGSLRKLIIFTEYRATLEYLQKRVAAVLGESAAVAVIHGGTHRDERRKIQAEFRSDRRLRILVATDAAGEGVNLQNANLMVNYDLPWNPNRIEQRFGRIHRIGQTEVCHLWNLVAKETREGDVYYTLLKKLETINKAFQGRVFDVLGEVFEGTSEGSLKNMLIDAIRYGDSPEVRAKLRLSIEGALDEEHVRMLLARNALAEETMDGERLFAVKEKMERAEARRLQPHFVQAFFMRMFAVLGGAVYPREAGRWEVTHVPASLRERDRRLSGRNRHDSSPVLRAYERVCFSQDAVPPPNRGGVAAAVMLHPGHPLMLAGIDELLEKYAELLRRGCVLVDRTEEGEAASVIFLLQHEVRAGSDNKAISKRLQFVRVAEDGKTTFAGWAPHLDLEPLREEEKAAAARFVREQQKGWLSEEIEQRAVALAAGALAQEHYTEVASRHVARIEKTLQAVNERLTKEIEYWANRHEVLRQDMDAGKDVRLPLENIRRMANDLQARLDARKNELRTEKHVVSGTPVVLGGALVLSAGVLRRLCETAADSGDSGDSDEVAPISDFSPDAQARARIERLAMDAVRRHEEARGWRVVDVSADKCGWDLTSYPPPPPPLSEGAQEKPRHIEVKGRALGAKTITATYNEILYALNQAEKFYLAIVFVGENDAVEPPIFIKEPFDKVPDGNAVSVNYEIEALLNLKTAVESGSLAEPVTPSALSAFVRRTEGCAFTKALSASAATCSRNTSPPTAVFRIILHR